MRVRVDLNNTSLVKARVSYINGYKSIPSSVLSASGRVFVRAEVNSHESVAFILVDALYQSLINDGSKEEAELLKETCFGLIMVDAKKVRICRDDGMLENRRVL
ncbi:hypothetical protein KKH38_03595 [Patescibacteria group bacterium]|nr:hypothetical protein [Patescibacteria group bacterium]MCG2698241.1 hypothetical protein [Candidatus Parcubacteria bacterium]